MNIEFRLLTVYLPVMVNKERKEWWCCFETADKRAAEEKAKDSRLFYKKENGWEVSVQKKTTLTLNNWKKEWATEFFDMPEEWKPKSVMNPSIGVESEFQAFGRFCQRHMKFEPTYW